MVTMTRAVSFLGEGHHHGEDDDDEHGGSRDIEGLDDFLWSLRWVNGWELSSDSELTTWSFPCLWPKPT